jgi:hypothetical protein
LVTWLVAASLAVTVVGGGSLLMTRQNAPTVVANAGRPEAGQQSTERVDNSAGAPLAPAPEERATVSAPAPARTLVLAADVAGLSDGNLVQLMNDMDGFDALPASEPEPVISVDSGDSL